MTTATAVRQPATGAASQRPVTSRLDFYNGLLDLDPSIASRVGLTMRSIQTGLILGLASLGCGSGPGREAADWTDSDRGRQTPAASALDLPADRPLRAAFLIVDGVYNTELAAPYDVLQHTVHHTDPLPGIEVYTVSPDGEITTCTWWPASASASSNRSAYGAPLPPVIPTA